MGVLGTRPGLRRDAGLLLDDNLVAVAVLENQTGDAALDPRPRYPQAGWGDPAP